MASALDPVTVLTTHPMARAALGSLTSARVAFWMTLVANVEAKATYGTRLGGHAGDGRHDAYLCSLL